MRALLISLVLAGVPTSLVQVEVFHPSDGGYETKQVQSPVVFGPDSIVTSTLDLGPCTDATLCMDVDGGTAPTKVVTSRCACAASAGCFRSDGGVASPGMTLPPGSWSGSGCVPKVCTALDMGMGDNSWPASCPLQ